jgi:response regulator NasT
MTQYGMSEPDAFRWIQRAAMDHRLTMRQVADRIVAEGGTGSAEGAEA